MLDARGVACPIPVVMVQKAVKENKSNTIEVMVDNMCSVENIKRFANNNGYNVAVKNIDEEYSLVLTKK